MTNTQDGAGFALSVMSLGRHLDLDMAAEFVAHCREQLVGEASAVARTEARIKRSGEHVGRHRFFDRSRYSPAAFAGIVDRAGEFLERRIARERYCREIKQP